VFMFMLALYDLTEQYIFHYVLALPLAFISNNLMLKYDNNNNNNSNNNNTNPANNNNPGSINNMGSSRI